jgi:hypothetical protein
VRIAPCIFQNHSHIEFRQLIWWTQMKNNNSVTFRISLLFIAGLSSDYTYGKDFLSQDYSDATTISATTTESVSKISDRENESTISSLSLEAEINSLGLEANSSNLDDISGFNPPCKKTVSLKDLGIFPTKKISEKPKNLSAYDADDLMLRAFVASKRKIQLRAKERAEIERKAKEALKKETKEEREQKQRIKEQEEKRQEQDHELKLIAAERKESKDYYAKHGRHSHMKGPALIALEEWEDRVTWVDSPIRYSSADDLRAQEIVIESSSENKENQGTSNIVQKRSRESMGSSSQSPATTTGDQSSELLEKMMSPTQPKFENSTQIFDENTSPIESEVLTAGRTGTESQFPAEVRSPLRKKSSTYQREYLSAIENFSNANSILTAELLFL